MKQFLAVGLLTAWLLPQAFGVSRVGNSSVGSSQSGFTVDVPFPFTDILSFRDESVRLRSILPEEEWDPSGSWFQSFIDIKEFNKIYPALSFANQDEAREWYGQKGWQELASSNPCILTQWITDGKSLTAVATWGPGVGAVFIGFNRKSIREATTKMLDDIQLLDGACQW